MMRLADAPQDTPLRIMEIIGGHGIRRRLIALGLHRNDIIELDSRNIMGGPLLIRNINTDTSIGLGRGVARHIMVEIFGEKQ